MFSEQEIDIDSYSKNTRCEVYLDWFNNNGNVNVNVNVNGGGNGNVSDIGNINGIVGSSIGGSGSQGASRINQKNSNSNNNIFHDNTSL